jgi:antitoxin (DNA-binding transcriptional repressor) of toxin-antitoxin stability system
MSAITIEVAGTDLSRLLVQMQRVDELILTQNGTPVARVLPMAAQKQQARKGANLPVVSGPDFQISQPGDALEQEIAAFERQHPALVQQYLYRYVALYLGKVIDHDSDQLALLGRIDRQYPVAPILIRKVEPGLPKPLRVRSPRLRKAA